MKKFVAYFRVSTSKQQSSGLGLESQKTLVSDYVSSQKGELIESFKEVETGTSKKHRTAIYDAIDYAKKHDAKLVIAKLDRLARNVHFVSSLLETGVEFIACDLPEANHFTIHLFSALAEQEAKLISIRTKNALNELRKSGKTLGNPENLTDEAKQKGWEAIRQKARDNRNNKRATALILEYRAKGWSYDRIADQLNALNFPTSQGKRFTSTSVWRLYKRAEDIKNVA